MLALSHMWFVANDRQDFELLSFDNSFYHNGCICGLYNQLVLVSCLRVTIGWNPLSSPIKWMLLWFVVIEKAKLLILTKRATSRIQGGEMSFLQRVAGLSLGDKVRGSVIQQELKVDLLFLCINRSKLRWLAVGTSL